MIQEDNKKVRVKFLKAPLGNNGDIPVEHSISPNGRQNNGISALRELVKTMVVNKQIKARLIKKHKKITAKAKIKIKAKIKLRVKKKINIVNSLLVKQISQIRGRVSAFVKQKDARLSRRKRRRTWFMIRKDVINWRMQHKNSKVAKFLKCAFEKIYNKIKIKKIKDVKLTTFNLLCKETFNNILGTLVNGYGQVLVKCNSGTAGFMGSKRNSKYAASVVGLKVGKKAKAKNIKSVIIKLKKKATGKMLSFYRGFRNSGVKLKYVHLNIRNTHESFRVKKARRV